MDVQQWVYWILVAIIVYISLSVAKSSWRFCRIWIAACSFPSPPKKGWLSGHLQYMTSDENEFKFSGSLWKWGRIVNWQIGSSNLVMATHPNTAKAILQRPDAKETPLWRYTEDWLGEGLLTSKGAKWNRNRKLITPAFHFTMLRTFVPIFQDCFESLAMQWSEEVAGGTSIDVTKEMKFTTLECLLNCALGENGLIDDEKRHVLKEMDNIMGLWLKRMRTPHHHFNWIYKQSADGQSFAESVKNLNTYSLKVIEKCRNTLTPEQSTDQVHSPHTFVEVLLQSRDDDRNGLTTKEILDEVNTFLFAGHDTTGSAIPLCMYYLARHPEYQSKCRQEINDVTGGRKEITWETLSGLKYTTMFIKECLRMAGPVLVISRSAGDDIPLSDGRKILKGCQVGANIESVHYNPEVWKSPEVFDPLRFSPEQAEGRHAYAFLAFSAGPRHCIGQSFAMTELKVAIITFLRKFTLRLDEEKPMKTGRKPLMRSAENGLWLKMEHL